MALFRLEDLLAPRAETNVVLDLSTARPRTQQEFDKLLSHVPEFRIKPEKVRGLRTNNNINRTTSWAAYHKSITKWNSI